jgi:anti-sigma factor RsiW
MTELPYYKAPAGLRERVRSAARRAPRRPPVQLRPMIWLTGLAAALLLIASGALFFAPRDRAPGDEVASVLDGHLRSLVPGHLADVASTDQHTVKPWFAGKLDFSPPVVDAAGDGFPLVGGRVDVIDGRDVAALVYSRRNHIINLFVRPISAGEHVADGATERRGYHLLSWTDGSMRFWAVSDLNESELAQLQQLLVARTAAARSP